MEGAPSSASTGAEAEGPTSITASTIGDQGGESITTARQPSTAITDSTRASLTVISPWNDQQIVDHLISSFGHVPENPVTNKTSTDVQASHSNKAEGPIITEGGTTEDHGQERDTSSATTTDNNSEADSDLVMTVSNGPGAINIDSSTENSQNYTATTTEDSMKNTVTTANDHEHSSTQQQETTSKSSTANQNTEATDRTADNSCTTNGSHYNHVSSTTADSCSNTRGIIARVPHYRASTEESFFSTNNRKSAFNFASALGVEPDRKRARTPGSGIWVPVSASSGPHYDCPYRSDSTTSVTTEDDATTAPYATETQGAAASANASRESSDGRINDMYGTLQNLQLVGRCIPRKRNEDHQELSNTAFPPLPSVYNPAAEERRRRDQAFITDQLVPESLFNSGILAELRPTNFVLSILSDRPQVGVGREEVIFYIGSKAMQMVFDQKYFTIIVRSPSGVSPPLTVSKNIAYPKLLRCSFRPLESGSYWISVTLGLRGAHHIDNSPGFMAVNRHYPNCREVRPLMTRCLTETRSMMDAPGLSISVKSKIWGVTNDPETEQIYAADRDGHEILVFVIRAGELALTAKFGLPIPPDGWPFRPTGIAYCKIHKYIYVTDKDNHRVCVFERDGTFIGSFGQHGYRNGQFNFPWGVAVSPNGELLAVADARNHRLQLFNKNGGYIRKFTVFEHNPFLYKDPTFGLDDPRGICFDNTGAVIFVTDFALNKIFALDLAMRMKKTLVPELPISRPQGLAVDPCGNLLICNRGTGGNGSVQIINPGDQAQPPLTLEQNDDIPFNHPMDITICRGNLICVVDMSGTRIRIF